MQDLKNLAQDLRKESLELRKVAKDNAKERKAAKEAAKTSS